MTNDIENVLHANSSVEIYAISNVTKQGNKLNVEAIKY